MSRVNRVMSRVTGMVFATVAILSMFASTTGAGMTVYQPDWATVTNTPGYTAEDTHLTDEDWAITIGGINFSNGDTIVSGSTLLSDAIDYRKLPQGFEGSALVTNGRAVENPNLTDISTLVVSYAFDTALDDVDRMLLWNYAEDWDGQAYNNRGITNAAITVYYDSDQSMTFTDAEFALTPNVVGTHSSAQQYEFGQVFQGVTRVDISDIKNGGDANYRGWGEFAVATIPEPGTALLTAVTLALFAIRRFFRRDIG